MFDILHLDVYQLIFAYLSQQDLLTFLLINRTFYQQIMKYIDSAKLLKNIQNDKDLKRSCRSNMIITIKLNNNEELDWNFGLEGACQGGHCQLAQFVIKKGANYWSSGLYGACKGGHKKFAEWMIKNIIEENDTFHTIASLNSGLLGACKGGHIQLAQFMIEKGADKPNYGLCGACEGGHKNIMKSMIEKGAYYCEWCYESMDEHLK